jgi:putative MFS transporter
MAGGAFVSGGSDSPRIKQLEESLNRIGITNAHKMIIFLILLGCLFDAFEQNAVGIVAPLLREHWGLTATDIGLLNTITFAAAAIGRLLTGIVADKYGRRVMLGINLLLFTLGAAICAFAPNYWTMAFGRAVVGFGLGGEISIAVTMLAEFCSARSRGTAVALVNVGAGGFGNFLAPGFGLLVFTIFPGPEGWRWLFICLIVPALLAIFYRRFIPETPRFLLSKGDIAGANRVLSKLASGKLTREPAVKEYISASLKEGEVVAQKPQPTEIFKGVYGRRTVPVAIAIWMTYGAQLSILTLMPLILMAKGHSIAQSLMFTMIMQGGSLCGAIAASFLGYHLPRKRVLTIGAMMACLAALGFGFMADSIATILICGAVFQFFVLLLNTTIWIWAPELYPTRMRAFGTAFILATGSAAGALMPLLAGRLLDGIGVAAVFSMITIMYVIFAICVQLAPETFGRSMEDLNLPAEPTQDPVDEPIAVSARS